MKTNSLKLEMSKMKLLIKDVRTEEVVNVFVPIEYVQKFEVHESGVVEVLLWTHLPLSLAKEMVDDIRAASGQVKLYVDGWELYHE